MEQEQEHHSRRQLRNKQGRFCKVSGAAKVLGSSKASRAAVAKGSSKASHAAEAEGSSKARRATEADGSCDDKLSELLCDLAVDDGGDDPLAEDDVSPLSGAHSFFTTTMSKRQEILTRIHCHLPESRVPAALLCRGQSWATSYCDDLKCKKLGAEWRDFAVDNRLRVGDAYVFEVITPAAGGTRSEGDEKEVIFRVQVLHGDLPEEITSRGATSNNLVVIIDN